MLEFGSCLEVMGKKINIAQSELLLQEDFSSAKINRDAWIELNDASWEVNNHALEGKWTEGKKANHGQIFTKQTFTGDVLMEFDAATILPSNHDIIWWWGVKLNADKTSWVDGYLAALGGWFSNKAGVEKLEGDDAYMALSPLFKLEAGKTYKIHCGMVDGTVFLFADGQLIMEFLDPKPLAQEIPGHIGFGLYQSQVKFGNLKVYKPQWEQVTCSY
jgi:hypothetical protein